MIRLLGGHKSAGVTETDLDRDRYKWIQVVLWLLAVTVNLGELAWYDDDD